MARLAVLSFALFSCGIASSFLGPLSAEADDYYLRFPWKYQTTACTTRGYGTGSHINQDYYALDFDVLCGPAQGTVTAAAAGTVEYSVSGRTCAPGSHSYGNYVDVKARTPAGNTRWARYAHLASHSVAGLAGVARGQRSGSKATQGT